MTLTGDAGMKSTWDLPIFPAQQVSETRRVRIVYPAQTAALRGGRYAMRTLPGVDRRVRIAYPARTAALRGGGYAMRTLRGVV